MKKFKNFGLLAVLGFMLLASVSTYALPKPNNYIGSNGHLYVLYQGSYIDMGPYHP